jgi:hypothetical protein
MSDHNQSHGHNQHEHGHDQVESSAIKPKPILMFLVILAVATAFVFVIVKGMEWGLAKLDEAQQGQPATQVSLPAEQSRKLPPEPLLQGAPGKGSTATSDSPTDLPLEEMAKYRKQVNEKVAGYGWVDKQTGVAHIPIERAKEMIASQGLPSLPATAISDQVQQAEATRRQTLNADSSAGRMLKAIQQSQQPVAPPQSQQQSGQQGQQGQTGQPQGQQPTQPQGQQQKPK